MWFCLAFQERLREGVGRVGGRERERPRVGEEAEKRCVYMREREIEREREREREKESQREKVSEKWR